MGRNRRARPRSRHGRRLLARQSEDDATGRCGHGPAGGAATKGGPGAGGQAAATPVETAVVEATRLPQSITTVGSLRSDESVTLRPRSPGGSPRSSSRRASASPRERRWFASMRRSTRPIPAGTREPLAREVEVDRAVDLSKSNFISGQARDEAESNFKVAEASLSPSKRGSPRWRSRRRSRGSSACARSRSATTSKRARPGEPRVDRSAESRFSDTRDLSAPGSPASRSRSHSTPTGTRRSRAACWP